MKAIKHNENYLINEEGRIWSKKSKRYLTGSINHAGYKTIQVVGVEGKLYTLYVHRLVAEYYIQNTGKKSQVNHIDGNKLNNIVSNLEWVTPMENMHHASKVLNKNVFFKKGTQHINAKLNPTKVIEIKTKYADGGYTYRSLAKAYGVSHVVINQIMNNRIWIT